MVKMFQTLHRVMRSASDTLKLRCEACTHQVEFERTMAFTYFGADSTPPDVRRRARCSECGARGSAQVWV